MLVENQLIKMRWHYKNKPRFESRGYQFTSFGNEVIVKAEDLSPESHEKVMVRCDGCGYKVLRFFSSGKLPTREQIKSNIDVLLNTDIKYIRIDMT